MPPSCPAGDVSTWRAAHLKRDPSSHARHRGGDRDRPPWVGLGLALVRPAPSRKDGRRVLCGVAWPIDGRCWSAVTVKIIRKRATKKTKALVLTE